MLGLKEAFPKILGDVIKINDVALVAGTDFSLSTDTATGKDKMLSIRKKVENGQLMNHSEWAAINSYDGWLKPCDSWRLKDKYLTPIVPDAYRYYREVVKRKAV